jgi:hypothetical protein
MAKNIFERIQNLKLDYMYRNICRHQLTVFVGVKEWNEMLQEIKSLDREGKKV